MSMFDDLYGGDENKKMVVKPAVGVVTHPTVIQSFTGEVCIIYRQDGKIVRQEYPSVSLATEYCESFFHMRPILFEKGYIVGSNGVKEEKNG